MKVHKKKGDENYRGRPSLLTEAQIKMLKNNPNIAKITPRQVNYTQTFKNYFCREYAKGRTSSEILREQGIDPKILGETRVSSLRTYYNTIKRSFPGSEQLALGGRNAFRDKKGDGHTELNTNTEIIQMIGKLSQQVQYLEKETDFLKKIFAAGELTGNSNTISKKIKNSRSLNKPLI